jgi:transposase, IS5 family
LRRGHDLSDGRLAEARADRASFRRFCGFARDAATPGRTALVRFRLLAGQGLGRTLFEAIAGDLERKGATVRQGAPIDAGPASTGDKQAAWAKPKSRAPAHGYKAHIAADKDRGIVRATEPTPANEADVALAPALIPNPPGEENSASGILGGEVYGDQADDALSVERAIAAAGGTSKIWRNGHRWLAAEKLAADHRPLRPIRSRAEKIFATWKRTSRFRPMRWRGLAKAKPQVRRAAIASNINRFRRRKAG